MLKFGVLLALVAPCFCKHLEPAFVSGVPSVRGGRPGSSRLLATATSVKPSVYEEFGVTDVLNAKPFSLPPLPWDPMSLGGISKETIAYHYGKHHATYVRKLNGIAKEKPEIAAMSLEDVVKKSDGAVFNNAAQIWNHNFYWNCLKPNGGGTPTGPIAQKINEAFGSFEAFKEQFSARAAGHFGSGWVWLVQGADGKLNIVDGHDAANPVRDGGDKPVMVIDVWEHAYYIDFRNARPNYINAFFDSINWDFVNSQLA
ncbi:unnamed protein product [Vitrella brassicaformis CCMP3155]|uniref:Superoxide dismutase n=1 Tax=Vitrella brassicaformis (strain CCMP3155) TaxID=1169540 RepID=A0A0G4EVZ1_VITBC|nr:unnamed protein product [Vitrella brassicaformis CCMP3155]|mmetsp:Transcript_19447/g.47013  ORF Transcript_19447/g.47013 Transcript_19447/m.47013 type:complete len:257 (-) Transcript_19447:237-1007(-)|eukprot:CEM02490.1 unnamed protein product [Vitrella brassicaformis CCMP3155]